ncbi:hypothetical protein EV182_008918, partial [Spiromyces aspiralis]
SGYGKYLDTIVDRGLLNADGVIVADNGKRHGSTAALRVWTKQCTVMANWRAGLRRTRVIALYRGQVARLQLETSAPRGEVSRSAKQMHAFNRHVKASREVRALMLPMFDGLTLISLAPRC